MKVVILAGGYGTRISEETDLIPKPLVKINRHPILWHIMMHYAFYDFNEFIICCGYKGEKLVEYFNSQRSIVNKKKKAKVSFGENFVTKKGWKVTLVDTGKDTMTGGRIRRIKPYINKGENFFMTYGDGLSNINLKKLLNTHIQQKTIATISAVAQPNRFGVLKIRGKKAMSFEEKPLDYDKRVNGGFFVLSSNVFKFINSDRTIWEKNPLKRIAKIGELSVFKHNGFWQSMDTLRDKRYLEKLGRSKTKKSWKIWNE